MELDHLSWSDIKNRIDFENENVIKMIESFAIDYQSLQNEILSLQEIIKHKQERSTRILEAAQYAVQISNKELPLFVRSDNSVIIVKTNKLKIQSNVL